MRNGRRSSEALQVRVQDVRVVNGVAKSLRVKPPTPHGVRAYLRNMIARAGIDKKVTPHKLRHIYATRLLESGAELVDIQALLGHVNLATGDHADLYARQRRPDGGGSGEAVT